MLAYGPIGCNDFWLRKYLKQQSICQRANADRGMCEKCAELDRKIEHYERISALIGDQLTVGRIKELVVKMKVQKAEFHPPPTDKSP